MSQTKIPFKSSLQACFGVVLVLFLGGDGLAAAPSNEPPYELTDLFASAHTSLLQAGINGSVKEIWGGMDATRMRVGPMYLLTAQSAQMEKNGHWIELSKLHYNAEGTSPGHIQLQTDDGEVKIVMSAKKTAKLSPLFMTYSFKSPRNFRWGIQFSQPEWIQKAQIDESTGAVRLSTLWGKGRVSAKGTAGPDLTLAAKPFNGLTIPEDGRYVFKADAAREVVVCVDATESAIAPAAGSSYVDAWIARLGGTEDSPADLAADRVQLSTDNQRLDRLFAASLNGVAAAQFNSGVVMGDVFYYRDSWLRDGTYSIVSAALAGRSDAVDTYFKFWMANGGFSANGEREAQQPGICLTGIWFCSRMRSDDRKFLNDLWPYVKKYGDYFKGRVDREGMLDLTEEWICFINTKTPWPNAEVYSGLIAASKIAERLGHDTESQAWKAAAARLKEQFLKIAFDSKLNRFIPLAGPDIVYADPEQPKRKSCNGPLRDGRVDSGMLNVSRLEVFGKGQGIVSVDDPQFAATQAYIIKELEGKNHSVTRFGKWPNPHSPQGEPDIWPIICGWASQVEWLKGRTDRAWRYLLSEVDDEKKFTPVPASYYLPECWKTNGTQPDVKPAYAYYPIITWSHGEFVTTTIQLLLGLDFERTDADLGLAPSLPPELKHATLEHFRFRDWKMDFELTRSGHQIAVKLKPEYVGKGEAALTIELPSGQHIQLQSKHEEQFTVDPAQYGQASGRAQNTLERARVIAKILMNQEIPADLGSKTPEQQEQYIRSVEDSFFGE
jgi:hypothetical protein